MERDQSLRPHVATDGPSNEALKLATLSKRGWKPKRSSQSTFRQWVEWRGSKLPIYKARPNAGRVTSEQAVRSA